ncbi:MAG TPA: hypothetical protein DCK76_01805 [Desulfotomaculum sp.]|nr:MAG: hypothetical protein XD78_0101 [Desulfotomaculum sp. 46_296]HAG10135.1 hypothetical protein [Desulfotomaculum sp.]HBY03674.1 hypothetical protein [Desulfotomaculum sp.]
MQPVSGSKKDCWQTDYIFVLKYVISFKPFILRRFGYLFVNKNSYYFSTGMIHLRTARTFEAVLIRKMEFKIHKAFL